MRRFVLVSFFCLTSLLIADPPPVGNFALPISQQVGPLVGFGQNILGKGQVITYLFADAFIGNDSYEVDVIPSVVYGIRDDLSLFLQVPVSPGIKEGKDHSAGFEDMSLQLEYVFVNTANSSSTIQATLVGNVAFPTGSSSKNPPTGFGSTSFFLGSTFCYTTQNWVVFTSPGAILTTSSGGTQFGDAVLYQFGLARNIPSPSGWVFAWMVEFDGQYTWKNTIHGKTDPNSGGNVVYLTPSIWMSSKMFILQFGAGYPIVQHLFGDQFKQWLSFDFNFGVTF
jgi:hypothetical protein